MSIFYAISQTFLKKEVKRIDNLDKIEKTNFESDIEMKMTSRFPVENSLSDPERPGDLIRKIMKFVRDNRHAHWQFLSFKETVDSFPWKFIFVKRPRYWRHKM